MNLKQLDEKEITKLYNEHMVIDFPKDELKPLNMIILKQQIEFLER